MRLSRRTLKILAQFGKRQLSTQPSTQPLPLIITPHPCQVVPDRTLSNSGRFQRSIREPLARPTVSEEVTRYQNGPFRYFWDIAAASPIPLELNNWVAKESDRNPNQPAVILFGIAMDHLFMAKLYEDLIDNHHMQSVEVSWCLAKINHLANQLKSAARREAAQTCLLNPSAFFSQHLQEQFFDRFSPEDYLARSANHNGTTSQQLLEQLTTLSSYLSNYIHDAIGDSHNPELEAVRRQIQTLPPWGPQMQGRLPAEDVIAAAEYAIKKMGLGQQADSATLLRAIEAVHKKPTTTFKRDPHSAYSEEDNTIRFFEIYHALGKRMDEVVLANYEDHTAYLSAHLLSLLTNNNSKPGFAAMPLAEDARTLRNLADDFKTLYRTPYFYQLAQQIGLYLFIARSDTTRSSGTPSGNFEVMACLKEVTEMLTTLFAGSGNLPAMKIILGQGSSASRGLFLENSSLDYDPYLLPISWHPNIRIGVTIQPGPGQSRFATPESALKSIQDINTYNEDSPARQEMADQFSTDFVSWMRGFERPGESMLRQTLNNPKSWWNQAIKESPLPQQVLDRPMGSRWKKQHAEDIELFNEQRAITVFALNKEFGFPTHTVIPFVYSVRAFMQEHPEALHYLANLYQTHRFFHKHIQEIHQCLLDGNEDLIAQSGTSKKHQQMMTQLLRESTHYLTLISHGELPLRCSHYAEKQRMFQKRDQSKAAEDPRYMAHDHPPGTYA